LSHASLAKLTGHYGRFAWQLDIPRTSAPHERCAFGRVYHRLHAIAEGSSGTIKEDVVIEVVVNPADEGETMGLNERIEGFNEEIGVCHIAHECVPTSNAPRHSHIAPA